MNESLIMNHFILLTGLTSEDALPYQPLCRASMEKVLARLGSWVDTGENQERIAMAIAADAAYIYLLTQKSEGSFRLGDLSVDGTRLEEMSALKEMMERTIGDLLEQEAFAFEGVGQ